MGRDAPLRYGSGWRRRARREWRDADRAGEWSAWEGHGVGPRDADVLVAHDLGDLDPADVDAWAVASYLLDHPPDEAVRLARDAAVHLPSRAALRQVGFRVEPRPRYRGVAGAIEAMRDLATWLNDPSRPWLPAYDALIDEVEAVAALSGGHDPSAVREDDVREVAYRAVLALPVGARPVVGTYPASAQLAHWAVRAFGRVS